MSSATITKTVEPGATVPQHLVALEWANHVRLARADAKRKVASRELSVAETIREIPAVLERMSLGELLEAQPGWGRTRVRKFLNMAASKQVYVDGSKRLGQLTERQRDVLAALHADTLKFQTRHSA